MIARPEFHPHFSAGITGDVLRSPHVRSAHLEHPRDVLVWLPPGYHHEPHRRYPVLYMHDGQNTFDPATSFIGRDWNVDGVATDLIHRGVIEPIIMVAIYNSPDRLHEYNPLERGSNYGHFIFSELMPAINAVFRTEGGRRNAVMGSSMGGLISLALLWWYPHVYMGAACLSPSLWVLRRAGGPAAWLRAHRTPSEPTRVYIDHGVAGVEGRGAPLAREAVTYLASQGIAHPNVHYAAVRGGKHNEVSWGARVHKPLTFLFGRKRLRKPRHRAGG